MLERKKPCQSKILYLEKLPLKNYGNIKTFSDKGKLRELIQQQNCTIRNGKEFFEVGNDMKCKHGSI